MYLKNTNPLGQVDVPILHRQGEPIADLVNGTPEEQQAAHGSGCLEPGEVFECSDAIGEALLEQVGNYQLVDAEGNAPKPPAKKVAAKKGD